MSEKKPTLRSAQWFGTADKNEIEVNYFGLKKSCVFLFENIHIKRNLRAIDVTVRI